MNSSLKVLALCVSLVTGPVQAALNVSNTPPSLGNLHPTEIAGACLVYLTALAKQAQGDAQLGFFAGARLWLGTATYDIPENRAAELTGRMAKLDMPARQAEIQFCQTRASAAIDQMNGDEKKKLLLDAKKLSDLLNR